MAARPKLAQDEWEAIQRRWEADEREGYTWLVKELGLPVSAPAVRKRAIKDDWLKLSARKEREAEKKKEARASRKAPPKESGNHRNQAIVSENHGNHEGPHIETIRGRPTLYRPEYCAQVYKLCLLGQTDEDIADFFMIAVQTLYNWQEKHPDFLESMRNGKVLADAEVVESLYRRAVGYSHDDLHIAVSMGDVIKTEIKKHYPPDVTAQRFWLKNRRPHDWKEKVEVKEEVSIEAFPDVDTLKEIFDESQRRSLVNARKHLGRADRLGLTIDQADLD